MAFDPVLMEAIAPVGVSAVFIGTIGWVTTTWLRVKNGYPLESSWGKPLLPGTSKETEARLKLVTEENAQLRAEVSAVKDRLAVLERIAVDRGARLADEIAALERAPVN